MKLSAPTRAGRARYELDCVCRRSALGWGRAVTGAWLPLTITLHGSTYPRLRGRNRVVFRGMSTHDDEDDVGPDELAEYRICSGCIGEKFLQVDVENTGETQDCSYCGKSGRTLSVGDLAKAVEVALDEHYYQTPIEPEGIEYIAMKEGGHWERHGEPVTYVIADMAKIDEEPAEDVRRVLEARDYFDKDAGIAEGKFDEEAYYAESKVEDYELRAQWHDFQESLKTESRFFNRSAESTLKTVFEDLTSHTTHDGKPAIVEAGPGKEINVLYRARVFLSSEKLTAALKRPDLELGPPPSLLASAGRMNARGIAVFYGATDPTVVLAETRPPVGSRVAVGRFEIIQPLQLLDIEVLRSIYVDGSVFDSGYLKRLEKAKFLRTMSGRISAAVLPDDEPFQYLVTQAIAEYLAALEEPALDGIIYPSVQAGGKHKNVVLFHKSARVDQLDIPPNTEISAYLESSDEDGAYPEYWVSERTPTPPPAEAEPEPDFPIIVFSPAQPGDFDDPRPPTLRLDAKSVTVEHIESVTYETSSFQVSRNRFIKN